MSDEEDFVEPGDERADSELVGEYDEDETTDAPGLRVTAVARAFAVVATGAGLAAFNVGFDLGAFANINHRRFFAVWVICTVALVSSFLFRNADYRLGGHWRIALGVPTAWLVADLTFVTTQRPVVIGLAVVSVAALPFALYVLAHLLAGDYFTFPSRLRWALGILTAFIFVVGLYVGDGHPRFLTCDDFALAGEYQPENCRP
jgi:hypothetical protein